MSKWLSEWAEAGAICAMASVFLVAVALVKGRWFWMACAVVTIVALSGCEFGHGR